MNHAEKEVQFSSEYEEPLEETVFRSVLYITHKSPLLQELFFKWINLNAREKVLLNHVAFYNFNSIDMKLYTPLIKAIGQWDTVQDCEGACGYHRNPLETNLHLEDEKRLFRVILDTNRILSTIEKKIKLCNEIKNLKHTCLKSSKKSIFSTHAWGDKPLILFQL